MEGGKAWRRLWREEGAGPRKARRCESVVVRHGSRRTLDRGLSHHGLGNRAKTSERIIMDIVS
jgi:hypothetical protein